MWGEEPKINEKACFVGKFTYVMPYILNYNTNTLNKYLKYMYIKIMY